MCKDICTDMYTGMYTEMCTDMCTSIYASMCTGMGTSMCTGMCTDMCTDMFTDMCTDMFVQVEMGNLMRAALQPQALPRERLTEFNAALAADCAAADVLLHKHKLAPRSKVELSEILVFGNDQNGCDNAARRALGLRS